MTMSLGASKAINRGRVPMVNCLGAMVKSCIRDTTQIHDTNILLSVNRRKIKRNSNVGKTVSMGMLTLFESRYTLKGRYNIGNVGKTASMSMLTLFESRYTLKGRYNIGNVGQTASI